MTSRCIRRHQIGLQEHHSVSARSGRTGPLPERIASVRSAATVAQRGHPAGPRTQRVVCTYYAMPSSFGSLRRASSLCGIRSSFLIFSPEFLIEYSTRTLPRRSVHSDAIFLVLVQADRRTRVPRADPRALQLQRQSARAVRALGLVRSSSSRGLARGAAEGLRVGASAGALRRLARRTAGPQPAARRTAHA